MSDAYTKTLERALRDLGVNLDNDLQDEVRAINNRAAGDSAAAQHDLDCALRERDAAQAKIADLEAEVARLKGELEDRDVIAADLCAVGDLMDGELIPRRYGAREDGDELPQAERLTLLIASARGIHCAHLALEDAVQSAQGEIDAAHAALTGRGAPRYAGRLPLDLSARIRTL